MYWSPGHFLGVKVAPQNQRTSTNQFTERGPDSAVTVPFGRRRTPRKPLSPLIFTQSAQITGLDNATPLGDEGANLLARATKLSKACLYETNGTKPI